MRKSFSLTIFFFLNTFQNQTLPNIFKMLIIKEISGMFIIIEENNIQGFANMSYDNI